MTDQLSYRLSSDADQLSLVQSKIQETVKEVTGELGDILRYQTERTGKLLRPLLVLRSWALAQEYAVLNGSASGNELTLSQDHPVIKAAAAIELLHMATLIHDDIIDGALIRRDRKTVQALFGAHKAVLAGDLMLVNSFRLVSELLKDNRGLELSRALDVVCRGEVLQMKKQDISRPSLRRYRRQIGAKTAVLFALACRSGAELSKLPLADSLRFQRAGYAAGCAFQICDDILDLGQNKDSASLGKSSQKDLAAGILTYPYIAALASSADTKELEKLKKSLSTIFNGSKSKAKLRKAAALTLELGGEDQSRTEADRYMNLAYASLAPFSACDSYNSYIKLLSYLVKRTY